MDYIIWCEKMNKYKKLLSDTVILGIGTFASKALVLLMMPLYTQCLSPSDYGTADIISQTANLLIPLACAGICDGLFRFTLDADEGRRKHIFTASMLVLTIGSIAVAAICFALSYTKTEISEYFWLVALYVVCANFHSACAHYMRAKGKTVLFAAQGLINTVSTIAFNIVFNSLYKLG